MFLKIDEKTILKASKKIEITPSNSGKVLASTASKCKKSFISF